MLSGALQRGGCNIPVTKATIAVGSNLPSEARLSERIVLDAIESVALRAGCKPTLSRFYRTPAFPPGSGPDFVNAAFAIDWAGRPEALLDLLHDVEAEFGRTRTRRWEARVLDLDLIAFGDTVHPDAATQTRWRSLRQEEAARAAPEALILPHPRLQDRGFVLVPMADIVPDWRHPLTGETVSDMLSKLSAAERAEIRPLDRE